MQTPAFSLVTTSPSATATTTPLRPAALVLADGTVFEGSGFGAQRNCQNPMVGEVVFNTSMSGYQEILTDPSYAGQLVTFTHPNIGNVGCNAEDMESNSVFAQGVICRNLCETPSNFRSEESLSEFLGRWNVMGITNVDTRQLTIHLRTHGSQPGAIGHIETPSDISMLHRAAQEFGSMAGKNYVNAVSCRAPYSWKLGLGEFESKMLGKPQVTLHSPPLHIVAIDCGIKHSILRLLVTLGARVTVVPASTSATEILSYHPDGVFLSNGPGDPETLQPLVATVRVLLGQVPLFGICLGHQILGQALGAKTYKLKFGHRGGNHPVKELATGRISITVQNHGFAVDPASLQQSPHARISHINLNDQTVEGIDAPTLKAFSVQYHPESSPGPHDARDLFSKFERLMRHQGGQHATA